MYHFLLALHVTAAALVVGTLFVQSLAVIFRFRLPDPQQVLGAQWIQRRIYLFIYYPILIVAVGTGFYLAIQSGAFTNGKWLHWKLMGLMALMVFGFLNGRQIQNLEIPKPLALMVHIAIFCTSAAMIYLVSVKPF